MRHDSSRLGLALEGGWCDECSARGGRCPARFQPAGQCGHAGRAPWPVDGVLPMRLCVRTDGGNRDDGRPSRNSSARQDQFGGEQDSSFYGALCARSALKRAWMAERLDQTREPDVGGIEEVAGDECAFASAREGLTGPRSIVVAV